MSRLTNFGSYSRNWDLREAQPLRGKGKVNVKTVLFSKLVYFSHMSSSNFRPLKGAYDLWKSCSKCEAESIKHLIQTCLRVNIAENMSYHISCDWMTGSCAFRLMPDVFLQWKKLFSWLSPTTFSVTAKYVFIRKPGLLWEIGRETPVAAGRHRTDFKWCI